MKTKYDVGQEVWHISEDNSLRCLTVCSIEISGCEEKSFDLLADEHIRKPFVEYYFTAGHVLPLLEKELFPDKCSTIASKLMELKERWTLSGG